MIKIFTNLKKVCAAVVVSLFLLQGGALAAGNWLVTKEGPKIWNENPQPNETASWSGAADAQGYAAGRGVLKWFVDGKMDSVYEGDFVGGKYNGEGVWTSPSGERYVGDFVDGNFNGKGVLTFPSGGRYEGDFVDGNFNGKGFRTYADGGCYEGDFVGGKYNGEGVYWSNRLYYEGGFVDGQPNGKGVVIYADGERLEGIFENGKLIKRIG